MNHLPDNLAPDLDDGDVVVGRVFVYRIITTDGGMRDDVRTDDGHGQEVDMPTAVGMLAIAQHTMLCDGFTSEDQ